MSIDSCPKCGKPMVYAGYGSEGALWCRTCRHIENISGIDALHRFTGFGLDELKDWTDQEERENGK